jgi:NADPH:quinone reductase-like Zn-dependent oxidoreductase
VVEEVGRKVTKDLKKGDRVAGFVHGGNQVQPEDGAFGEYITAKGDLQIKIPENLSFEEASTLGVGITTYVSRSTHPPISHFLQCWSGALSIPEAPLAR